MEKKQVIADWDSLWRESFPKNKFFYRIWYWDLWKAYQRLLKSVILRENSRVLEIGCGSGTISLHLAKKYGCKITLVDTSKAALDLASRIFCKQNVEVEIINSDGIEFDGKGTYDLVHSEGLIEHFKGENIRRLLLSHSRATRPNGYVITFAPYPSFFYYASSWVMKETNNWFYGHETPLSLREYEKLHQHVVSQVKLPPFIKLMFHPVSQVN